MCWRSKKKGNNTFEGNRSLDCDNMCIIPIIILCTIQNYHIRFLYKMLKHRWKISSPIFFGSSRKFLQGSGTITVLDRVKLPSSRHPIDPQGRWRMFCMRRNMFFLFFSFLANEIWQTWNAWIKRCKAPFLTCLFLIESCDFPV